MFQNKLLNISIMIMISILVLGVIFFFLYQYTFASNDPNSTKSNEVKEKSIEDIIPLTVTIPQINTNLGDSTIVSIELILQTDNSKAKDELEQRMFQVKDRINLLLKNLTVDSINTEEKLIQFKTELKNRLNRILLEGKIEQVDITQLIYQ